MNADNLYDLREARPFVRSILAFLVYMRYGTAVDGAYDTADVFLNQLEADIREQPE